MINVTRSSIPPFEEYIDEIRSIWDTHCLTNMGEKHRKLQAELEAFFNCAHVALFSNGHLALESAISSFNFPRGGEVITTPFTFASTTHAITRNGLIPVFCDIDPITYTINPHLIEKLISPKTVAIIPVHVYGNICDVEAIRIVAEKYNLKVIYDAAHAFAVKYRGISSACFGDASMFSFHATKVFNTIEGGAVCFTDDSKVELLNDLKNFGIHGPDKVERVGGNAKMNEFQAAMGICNLRHLTDEIEKRKKIYEHYFSLLSGIKGINLCQPQPEVDSNYAYFPVIFDGYQYSRDEVCERLKTRGIFARKYFYPLINNTTAYRNLLSSDSSETPIAEYIANRVLTLPMYSDLSLKDVRVICDTITQR